MLTGTALAGVIVVSALAVVLGAWMRGVGTGSGRPDDAETPLQIEVEADLFPKTALFGDTVRAHVDVVLDTTLIDPDSVRVATDFLPWAIVGRPERRAVSAGGQAYLRTSYVLRCLSSVCLPSGRATEYVFAPGRVSFVRLDRQSPDEDSLSVEWPSVRVYSRFATGSPQGRPIPATPWQADLVSIPEPSLRIDPNWLIAALLLGAGVAAFGGFALAYLAWPRRELLPPPPLEAKLPPEPPLSALEQALVLLEESVRRNGAADQRRALELVAEELEQADWGDPRLARAARVLAWSESIPPADATSELAARVRAALNDRPAETESEVRRAE